MWDLESLRRMNDPFADLYDPMVQLKYVGHLQSEAKKALQKYIKEHPTALKTEKERTRTLEELHKSLIQRITNTVNLDSIGADEESARKRITRDTKQELERLISGSNDILTIYDVKPE